MGLPPAVLDAVRGHPGWAVSLGEGNGLPTFDEETRNALPWATGAAASLVLRGGVAGNPRKRVCARRLARFLEPENRHHYFAARPKRWLNQQMIDQADVPAATTVRIATA